MMWSVFFFLCIGLSSIETAIYHIDQVEIPGFEGKCYDKEAKIFYSKGEVIKNENKECAQQECLGFLEETGKVRIEILTCPVFVAGSGCTIIQDLEKPYPECCPQLVSMPSADPNICQQKQKAK